MYSREQINSALKKYWGYDAFRPKQEEIVQTLLAGRDVCVVMPTGGGKSLCYQLPAALRENQTAIVVSPLIALMQDQVAQLKQMGIPAAVLNSAQDWKEQRETERRAERGEFRLLYLSPERVAKTDVVAWLRKIPISFFVIDEAHCISEWGHEFRPDYRELKLLKKEFPSQPIAAFTASATRRVRHDIIEQLQLKEPGKFIASFHRRNLNYQVMECDSVSQFERLLEILRKHAGKAVIVYSPTIKRVGETVTRMEAEGIKAIGYHAKMAAAERGKNQEAWMAGDVNVLVGTIAFGLGINKPDVRAVVHLALPKSIEQYYQEAGRAGRDGEPADCFLLWRYPDQVLLDYFIRQIEDEGEQARAEQRQREIQRFAQARRCRHKMICEHFGESVRWEKCGACDVCLGLQVRTAQEAPARAPRKAKRARRGQTASQEALRAECDPLLLAALKKWRRERAQAERVPPFVIFHDSVLERIGSMRPKSTRELALVYGVGEAKLNRFGGEVLQLLRAHGKGVGQDAKI